ncbi:MULTISPECIES: AMP-dependent synthetase/ligase [Rhodobacterales]|jgi:long-chain acyl-CoA synthetase|uniref:AMP-binding protein n=4 Tax=Rhodobacterales TaxID=204455 RepID=A0A0A0EDQ1_9RHOB|nr:MULTISPECIES: AMP-binding protein [Rhodobacterales]AKO98997.1 Long-chain acyl-CoA synthetase (AMP-forming) [Marinovum algicola DG 898]KGM47317.1 AMP-binding protein [Pseudooceanicola atlanticus]MWB79498.1 AMP-binding protein [Pseudooceanicola pacificus]GGE51840.1 long-chain-fatty-acid--CoA ligase [Primorskyibacter flagellatus]|tara:strand:+ start:20437 stop:22356 length:1920 start_codon:yes stop_codon:yes gene_type:complete
MTDLTKKQSSGGDTIGAILARNASKHGSEIALREKERGIWKETTWAEYAEEVLACAAGLEKIGVTPGKAVLILGDNRARLYGGMLAISLLGAYAMPAYPGATLEELRHFLGEVEIVAAIAEDQEQVDKILELKDAGAEGIDHIIYDEARGLGFYEVEGLLSWDHLIEVGQHDLNETPGLREELLSRAKPEDPAIFLHSSGTTGAPKGIVLSQKNVLAAARNGHAAGAFDENEEILAYLPMAWVGDYAITVAAALLWRFTVNVPERQETVVRDMREIAPTFYLAAPRSWDQMLTTIQVGIENSTPLKKWLYHFFMDRAIAAETRKLNGKSGGVLEPLGRLLGEAIVFGPIKDQFGMSRLKNAFTGGEAIGEDTFVFYRALGIKLRQLYGQTENSAINAIQAPGEVRLHTVGKPAPGVEVSIAEDGEILVRSDSVFEGYFNKPEATAEALDGGWLHTGDAGYLEDDGHLVVLGRVSEVMHTADGERYVPNYIENRLKFSPYIKDAAVIGAGLKELTAMVCVDFEAVGHWAEVNGVPYVSYADLSQREEVATLLREAFQRVNKAVTEPLRLQRFVSLPKEFDPDDGEITRTRKLRRKVVQERYADVIAALYDGSKEVHVSAQVTYETGEVGKVERSLPIREV